MIALACEGIKRNDIELTKEIIRQVVETFPTLNYKPPVVIGHIEDYKDGDPAYGRVTDIKAIQKNDGKICLFGELKLSPYAQELLKTEKYDGFSVGIYQDPETGKYYLHHVAILGAYPPADQYANTKIEDIVNLSSRNRVITFSGGKKMDINQILENEETLEQLKQLISQILEEKLKNLSLSSETETQEEEQQDIEAMFKQEKIKRIMEMVEQMQISQEGKEALQQLMEMFKPVIALSGKKVSPFDYIETFIKSINTKPNIFEPIRLSSRDKQIDTQNLAKLFTGGTR